MNKTAYKTVKTQKEAIEIARKTASDNNQSVFIKRDSEGYVIQTVEPNKTQMAWFTWFEVKIDGTISKFS